MSTSSTKYLRKRTRVEISRSADYSDPVEDNEYVDEYTVGAYQKVELLASTATTGVDLSPFAAIDDLVIKNRDTTNYVDTEHKTPPGAGTFQHSRVAGGKSISLGSVTPSGSLALTANGAPCEIVVEIYGTWA